MHPPLLSQIQNVAGLSSSQLKLKLKSFKSGKGTLFAHVYSVDTDIFEIRVVYYIHSGSPTNDVIDDLLTAMLDY